MRHDESPGGMRAGPLLTVLLAAGLLAACEYGEVHDPWVTGDQYAPERSRSPETADRLRARLKYHQSDR